METCKIEMTSGLYEETLPGVLLSLIISTVVKSRCCIQTKVTFFKSKVEVALILSTIICKIGNILVILNLIDKSLCCLSARLTDGDVVLLGIDK